MTKSLEQIASDVRAAYSQGATAGMGILGSLAAAKIEIVHVPVHPRDGIWDGSAWAKAEHESLKMLDHALIGFSQELKSVDVSGDGLRTITILKGTLKDGTPLAHEVRTELTLKDGKIVKSVAYTNWGSESGLLILKALGMGDFAKLAAQQAAQQRT